MSTSISASASSQEAGAHCAWIGQMGVYNHVAGDGRELVVTDPTAVKVSLTSPFSTDSFD